MAIVVVEEEVETHSLRQCINVKFLISGLHHFVRVIVDLYLTSTDSQPRKNWSRIRVVSVLYYHDN